MAISRELIIKHLCERCNKEFDLTLYESAVDFCVNQATCPHCKTTNNLWISLTKKDSAKLGEIDV